MSKSKALSIEQTQTLRRRGRGVPKKSLDTGDRFIDGLKLANAFGVFQTEPVRDRCFSGQAKVVVLECSGKLAN